MTLGERVKLIDNRGGQVRCRVLGQKNGVLLLCRDTTEEHNTGEERELPPQSFSETTDHVKI